MQDFLTIWTSIRTGITQTQGSLSDCSVFQLQFCMPGHPSPFTYAWLSPIHASYLISVPLMKMAFEATTELQSLCCSSKSMCFHFIAFSVCEKFLSSPDECLSACHSLLQWTTFCQTSLPCPTCPGWPHMAWLNFTVKPASGSRAGTLEALKEH